MNSSYQHVIWDWNGTLLNDAWLCVDIVNKLLVAHNDLQLDEDSYREVFGFPISAYYQRIGIDLEKESFEELTQKFIPEYNQRVTGCQLHTDAQAVLQHFETRDLQQYILTAAHKDSVIELLQTYSLTAYFQAIEGLDNHRAESKVDRGIALIEHQKIDRQKAVMIGDTLHDYEVAEAIGVDCILIASGHQSHSRLETGIGNNGKVIGDVGQLKNWI